LIMPNTVANLPNSHRTPISWRRSFRKRNKERLITSKEPGALKRTAPGSFHLIFFSEV
jgi:hypothetical protein